MLLSCWPPVQNSVSPGELRWSLWNPRWLKPAVTKALKNTQLSPYLRTRAAQQKRLSGNSLWSWVSKFRSETLLTFSQIASPKISIRSRDSGENSSPRYTPSTVMWNGILKDNPPSASRDIALMRLGNWLCWNGLGPKIQWLKCVL